MHRAWCAFFTEVVLKKPDTLLRVITNKARCPVKAKRSRQIYVENFERDAIRMVIDNRNSTNKVARRLSVSGANMSRWVREYRNEQQATNSGGTAAVK